MVQNKVMGPWPRKGGRGQGHVTPFLVLNANFSDTVKDTDFKFDKRIPWDCPDMTPEKFLIPENFLVKLEVRTFNRNAQYAPPTR